MFNLLFLLASAAGSLQTYPPSQMAISPKERAADYKEAFENLKKEKGLAKVYFQLSSGETVGNIIEMNVMGNGHLILFKYTTQQGVKHAVVPVEQIALLTYHP